MTGLVLGILTAAVAAPPAEEVRAKAVMRWRESYDHLARTWDEVVDRLAAAGDDPAGLRRAKAERASIAKNPFDHPRLSSLNGGCKAGVAGRIPGQPAKVVKKDGDAWVVEVRHTYTRYMQNSPSVELLTLRLTDLPDAIKPRVGVPLKLPGFWVVTDGEQASPYKATLTVTPLVVKPDELPPECRPKAKKQP